MNQQEAQKNVLSEQFNEKLMNDYEALNIEVLSVRKDNQILVAENSRLGGQIKSMEAKIEELIDQSRNNNARSNDGAKDQSSNREEKETDQRKNEETGDTVSGLKQ